MPNICTCTATTRCPVALAYRTALTAATTRETRWPIIRAHTAHLESAGVLDDVTLDQETTHA